MIPNFVDTSRFCPGEQAVERAKFGLPPDRTVILCCAAIRSFHKRIDVLLQSFDALCRRKKTDAILVIAGGREAETDELIASGTRLLQDRVRFLPDLPRASMPDLYRAGDAFVLPSLHEMFGIVLLEALATGLPVLCNDTPGLSIDRWPRRHVIATSATRSGAGRGLADLLDQGRSLEFIRRGRATCRGVVFGARGDRALMLDMYRSIHAEAARARP